MDSAHKDIYKPRSKMSFSGNYYAEIQRLGPLFAAAGRADNEFHQARAYKQTDRYLQTLTCFKNATHEIDTIISTAFAQAKLGDSEQLPTLLAYISLPGRYFRSGYQRANIWRSIKRLSLDDEQLRVLHGIVIGQIETAGPEFSEIARAAWKVDSADFRMIVENIGENTEKHYVRRRVKHLLTRLKEIESADRNHRLARPQRTIS